MTVLWKIILAAILVLLFGCEANQLDETIEIPRSEDFPLLLSEYGIFEGTMAELKPNASYNLYELSSELFTDYAKKQRVIYIPPGATMMPSDEGIIDFPEDTIVAKTFYYESNGDRNVIETRVMVKREGLWNVADYVWNDTQDDASLILDGMDIELTITTDSGELETILYNIPSERACVTCHQSNDTITLLGTTTQNMNRAVERDATSINQLDLFNIIGISELAQSETMAALVNYNDENESVYDRGRAYLEVNCAHCHNASGWERAANRGYDFAHTTNHADTGLANNPNRFLRQMESGEMPYIGTDLIHEEGLLLVTRFTQEL